MPSSHTIEISFEELDQAAEGPGEIEPADPGFIDELIEEDCLLQELIQTREEVANLKELCTKASIAIQNIVRDSDKLVEDHTFGFYQLARLSWLAVKLQRKENGGFDK